MHLGAAPRGQWWLCGCPHAVTAILLLSTGALAPSPDTFFWSQKLVGKALELLIRQQVWATGVNQTDAAEHPSESSLVAKHGH